MVKRCNNCGTPLKTRKERFTGTCDVCARQAHEGFEMMAQGKMKKGFKQVMDVKFAKGSDDSRRRAVEAQLKASLKKDRNRIRKKLEKKVKKGEMTSEEMEQGLKEFEEVTKEGENDDRNNE